jgi:hypothetical protein
LVRSIFAHPDDASTLAQHTRVVAQLQERFPAVADLLTDAAAIPPPGPADDLTGSPRWGHGCTAGSRPPDRRVPR